MAKFICNEELKKNSIDSHTADSAGLYCYAGEAISQNAAAALREFSIDSSSHKSKPASHNLLKKTHLILCMTNSIKNTIQISFPEFSDKLKLLKNFSNNDAEKNEDISDPFGGDLFVYKKTRDEIHECIKSLIVSIRGN